MAKIISKIIRGNTVCLKGVSLNFVENAEVCVGKAKKSIKIA